AELTLRFARSQCSCSPVQLATFPSSKVSVTRPSNSKYPPGLVLPPLQASSHSRSLPGERGSVFGGGTKLRIFSSGISRGFSPLNPQKILPCSPRNRSPSSFSSPPWQETFSASSSGRAGIKPPSYH